MTAKSGSMDVRGLDYLVPFLGLRSEISSRFFRRSTHHRHDSTGIAELDNSGLRGEFACDVTGMGDALQRGEATQDVGSKRTESAGDDIVVSKVRVPTSIAGGYDRAGEIGVGRTAS